MNTHTKIAEIEAAQLRSAARSAPGAAMPGAPSLPELPDFRVGDTIRVHYVVERNGDKATTQVFQGVVIKRHRAGARSTFTVRKISFKIGVERIFLSHSPNIAKVELVSRGIVRRARLYYLRGLEGKAARIRDKKDI